MEESIVEFIYDKGLLGKYLILQLFKENLQLEYLVLIFMMRKWFWVGGDYTKPEMGCLTKLELMMEEKLGR